MLEPTGEYWIAQRVAGELGRTPTWLNGPEWLENDENTGVMAAAMRHLFIEVEPDELMLAADFLADHPAFQNTAAALRYLTQGCRQMPPERVGERQRRRDWDDYKRECGVREEEKDAED